MSNERSSWLWRDPGEAQRSREGGQESRRGAGPRGRGAGRGKGVRSRGGARGAGPLVFFWRRYEHSSHTRSRRKGGKRGWFSPAPAPAPGPGGVTGLAPEPVWACPGRLPLEGPGPRRGPALTPGGGTWRRQGQSAASRELS